MNLPHLTVLQEHSPNTCFLYPLQNKWNQSNTRAAKTPTAFWEWPSEFHSSPWMATVLSPSYRRSPSNRYRGQITWPCVTHLVSRRGRSWTQADRLLHLCAWSSQWPHLKWEKKRKLAVTQKMIMWCSIFTLLCILIYLPKRSTSFAVLNSYTKSLT